MINDPSGTVTFLCTDIEGSTQREALAARCIHVYPDQAPEERYTTGATTMILDISDVLARALASHAQRRGIDIEDFLREMLAHERLLAERKAIEEEQAWWLSRPLSDRAR